jgi:ATP-dependent Clp protease ATP-binding subunit ClpX
LDADALVKILTEPRDALVKQYAHLFRMDGVDLKINESALLAIAEKSIQLKTGARGLRAILENVLLDTMYDLPSQKDVTEVTVTEKTITENDPPFLSSHVVSPAPSKQEVKDSKPDQEVVTRS